MTHVHRLTIACILLGAVPALAADKPGVSSALPAVQPPAPGTTSRLPATAPVAPGAPATSAVVAGSKPLKCSVSVEHAGSSWGSVSYRSYKVTNSLGGRQALPTGSKIKWSGADGGFGKGGEHVLAAPLLPGQSVEVGTASAPAPKVDPSAILKGTQATQPTCEATLLP